MPLLLLLLAADDKDDEGGDIIDDIRFANLPVPTPLTDSYDDLSHITNLSALLVPDFSDGGGGDHERKT